LAQGSVSQGVRKLLGENAEATDSAQIKQRCKEKEGKTNEKELAGHRILCMPGWWTGTPTNGRGELNNSTPPLGERKGCDRGEGRRRPMKEGVLVLRITKCFLNDFTTGRSVGSTPEHAGSAVAISRKVIKITWKGGQSASKAEMCCSITFPYETR